MAYLESAVVVYLRALLYPEGFDFPLKPITSDLVVTELWREAATLIMLIGAGIMAGKNAIQRFAFFIYCFAVWDIFYYVFLKALLNWPESLFTWDVLFLIPVTWTGPVLSPVLVSVLMIILALFLIRFDEMGYKPRSVDWMLLMASSLIIIGSFCWDYGTFMLSRHEFSAWWSLSDNALFELSLDYIPGVFNWWLWSLGVTGVLADMLLMHLRASRSE